mgnify:CR=1 FL=1
MRRLARRGVRDFELLVQTRPDWFLETRGDFEAFLPDLEGLDARLSLYLVGFENFSQAELDRYDKGITVAQNREAIVEMGLEDLRVGGVGLDGDGPRSAGFEENLLRKVGDDATLQFEGATDEPLR